MPIHVIKSRRGKTKKKLTLGAEFSPKMFAYRAWLETVLSPLTVCNTLAYTADTAQLTNHDTRHARNNSRHIKEPSEMSLSASCLLRHTRCSVSFLVTQYPLKCLIISCLYVNGGLNFDGKIVM